MLFHVSVFFFKQKTAYEMRISDWSSDVCSSDLWSRQLFIALCRRYGIKPFRYTRMHRQTVIIRAPASFVQMTLWPEFEELSSALTAHLDEITTKIIREEVHEATQDADRSEEHTSELQSLMRSSYAVFCLKKQNKQKHHQSNNQ